MICNECNGKGYVIGDGHPWRRRCANCKGKGKKPLLRGDWPKKVGVDTVALEDVLEDVTGDDGGWCGGRQPTGRDRQERTVTRLFYDCEFIEDGSTIDLVSIGIVSEGGDEYYAVSGAFDQRKFVANPWLMENVFPTLPRFHGEARRILERTTAGWFRKPHLIDVRRPEVKSRAQIADEIRQFILSHPDPQLWAWYGAYDHVALCQLWGRMIDLPDGVPMWTNDLKQEVERLGGVQLPTQGAGEHNALEDARWLRDSFAWLATGAAGVPDNR